MKTIKEVFDHHLAHLKIDARFLKQVKGFQNYFLTKNDDHMHFFSEPLVGVYPIKWTSTETNMWFNDILECDEEDLSDDYLNLPSINPKFEISSKVANMVFLYLIYRAENTKDLKEKDKIDLKLTLMSILMYKFLTSIMNNNFHLSLADKSVALETYNRMTDQFDLKRAKSWGRFVTMRSETLVGTTSNFKQSIKYFDDDESLVKFVNEVKGRLNKACAAIMDEFYRVKEEGNRIATSSSTQMLEDDVVVKDLVRQQTNYIRYIQRIITDKHTFVKNDIRDVVVLSLKAVDSEFYDKLLITLCDSISDRKFKYLQDAIPNLIIYTFNLMKEENLSTNDTFLIATRIRQNFMAGRVNEGNIQKVKDAFDKFIHQIEPRTKRQVITSERVGLMMYIVLRALFMKHYSD